MYHGEVNPGNQVVVFLIHELVIFASSIIPSLLRTKDLGTHPWCQGKWLSASKGIHQMLKPEASNNTYHYSLQSPHLEFTTNWAESHYSTFTRKLPSGCKWSSAVDRFTICSKFTSFFPGPSTNRNESQIKSRNTGMSFCIIWGILKSQRASNNN